MLDIKLVSSVRDLEQILELQRANLAAELTPEDAASQGFVTAVHTLDMLQRMHALAPSVVARQDGVLAGYALTTPLACRTWLPVLESMCRLFDSLVFRGRPLAGRRLYVMGQVCVAKPFRGRGVFDGLYREHRARYGDAHDLLVTGVSGRNGRSLRAHQRVGFEIVHRYRDATDEWVIIAWDWESTHTSTGHARPLDDRPGNGP